MAGFDKRSLVDQVYEKLRGDILNLRYPLGGKVNVNELQKTIGVSCTPIREAINRLQQEGLIVYKNNTGAQILNLTAKDVGDIQELSMTLHQAAIRFSMRRGDKSAILKGLQEAFGCFSKAETPETQVNAVRMFVGVFYHTCKNERLDHTMISVQGLQLMIRRLYAEAGLQKEEDAKDFSQIIEAVKLGDAEAVCAVLQRNADRATSQVIAYLGAKS